MNLQYFTDIWGKRVRINVDELQTNKTHYRMYNQYGKPVDYLYRRPNDAKSIHKSNLVYGPVCFLPEPLI